MTKQDVLPVVVVPQLDGNDLQLAFAFVGADVPPARASLLGDHAVGAVRANGLSLGAAGVTGSWTRMVEPR